MKILKSLLALSAAAIIAACGDDPSGPGGVDSIVFPAPTQYVRLGTSAPVAVTLLNREGTAVPGATVVWSSSDTTVAAVSAAGTVAARAYGAATLTARAGRVSGSVTVQVTGQPGVRILSGGGVTDTITAMLPAPLVVEVRDSLGLPLAARDVYFQTQGLPTDPMKVGRHAGELDGFYRAKTDAGGRLSAVVQMSGTAGVNKLLVGSGSAADTAVYTVLPGAPVWLVLQPRDTAVFTGRQLVLRPQLMDRGRNTAPGTLSWSVRRGPGTVTPAGVLAVGDPGVISVQVRAGALVDSVAVSSVPPGAVVYENVDGMQVANLDGTGIRTLAKGRYPTWSPTGDRLVFITDGLYLATQTLTGPVVPVAGTGRDHRSWPQFSADGQWIYFQFANDSVARIRPDGTGRQVLGGLGTRAGHPSPSPDGTRMVFYDAVHRPVGISIANLVTGVVTTRLTVGHNPNWSPAGDLIAFTELDPLESPVGIMVMRPDGTGIRRLTARNGSWSAPRWSADGRWIIAGSGSHLHLFEVATGVQIPLKFAETSGGADLRPGGVLP